MSVNARVVSDHGHVLPWVWWCRQCPAEGQRRTHAETIRAATEHVRWHREGGVGIDEATRERIRQGLEKVLGTPVWAEREVS